MPACGRLRLLRASSLVRYAVQASVASLTQRSRPHLNRSRLVV